MHSGIEILSLEVTMNKDNNIALVDDVLISDGVKLSAGEFHIHFSNVDGGSNNSNLFDH